MADMSMRFSVLTAEEAKKLAREAFQKSSFSDEAVFVENGRNYELDEKDTSMFDQYCDMIWLVDGINLRSCDH